MILAYKPTRKPEVMTTISPVSTYLSVSMTYGTSMQNWRELGRGSYSNLSARAVRRAHHSIRMLSCYNGEFLVFIQIGKSMPPYSLLFATADIVTMS
jgi:hypothetical protein